jgi:phytoene synthase
MPAEDFNTLLHKADPDRRLAALFAPAETRDALLALYAFNHEIARIPESVSEPLIGEMRLTWWREAIEALYADPPKPRRHDVLEALAPLAGPLPQAEMLALIESRRDDLEAAGPDTLAAVEAQVGARAGGLMRLALRLAAPGADIELAEPAGRAWGLVGLLRAFPQGHARSRPPFLPELHDAVRQSAAQAVEALKPLRAPAEAFPAIGYAALAKGYQRRVPADPSAPPADWGLLGRQLKLTGASLTGRF